MVMVMLVAVATLMDDLITPLILSDSIQYYPFFDFFSLTGNTGNDRFQTS
jgi:hypothetical protein